MDMVVSSVSGHIHLSGKKSHSFVKGCEATVGTTALNFNVSI